MSQVYNKMIEAFTHKVEQYSKYRPNYPTKFIDYLIKVIGINEDAVVADIGSGSGILTKQLARNVNKIIAVEPNSKMRSVCIEHCASLNNLFVIDGSAEQTNLSNNSIDFITVAQAFHWFDIKKTKAEFERITKPNGKVVLVWNTHDLKSDLVKEMLILFKELCDKFKGFSQGRDVSPHAYDHFFKNNKCEHAIFDHNITSNLESFLGNYLSRSFAPISSDHNYNIFLENLTKIFNKYSTNDQIVISNKTHSYTGII